MKNKKKCGSLFGLLTRNYLLFTLVVLAIAGGVYHLWSAQLDRFYQDTDWASVAADKALRQGRYSDLSSKITADGILAVTNHAGKVLYCSNPDFPVHLTAGEISCVPSYADHVYADYVKLQQNGKVRYLVTHTQYDTNGNTLGTKNMLLDANYRVVSGSFGDGHTVYTPSEFKYLTGKLPVNYNLARYAFIDSDGQQRTALFYSRIWSEDRYEKAYTSARAIWFLVIPLYICAAGLFIRWLDLRIRRPLGRLNEAIIAQVGGHPISAGSCGGPAEIQRLGESFDCLSAQLKQSEEERKKLDEGRQKLVADISHDLKTPITVISGYADAICDGKVPPEQLPHYLHAIQKKAASLTELINAFHEYSKTEHPDFTLRPERTDLCEFSREYLAEKYDEVALAGFTLRVSIPEAPVYCRLDAFQFRRVLENLLSNSLRHNRLGTILFFEIFPAGQQVSLVIADNGDGIPPEKAASIFEPFVVGDDARSGEGSGLGLAITRRIIEKHGGTITLTAFPPKDRSTEFVIHLPADPA